MSKPEFKLVLAGSSDLTEPPAWGAEFDQYMEADKASATGATGWPNISTRSKIDFKVGDDSYGSELDVIIIGNIRENAYYPNPYNPQEPEGPACWALDTGKNEVTMAPPEGLLGVQSKEGCMTCWANAFKSDPKGGKGKACKNQVRLLVLPYSEGVDLATVPGARLRLPPTAQGPWSKYVTDILNVMHRPLFSVVTRLTIKQDDNTQFKLSFEMAGGFPDIETVKVLQKRVDDAVTQLHAQPEAPTEHAPPPGGKKPGAKPARRKVNKRKVAARRAAPKK